VNEADLAALGRAKQLLEHPGLAIQLADLAGRPVEWAVARLPARAGALVARATRAALDRGLALAIRSLGDGGGGPPRDWRHRAAVWSSGAAGGALGLLALPVELPVSTAVMLRSIAEHARAQGEDLSSPEARLSCLLVLALGGRDRGDDDAEAGYFAVRLAFARAVAQATEYLAGQAAAREVAEQTAPALVRLVTAIAARFGVAVEDKALAQLLPLVGAAGGALVNQVFIAHFQRTAEGHFTVRRLERTCGAEVVRLEYQRL
jgi:hypothetical protein